MISNQISSLEELDILCNKCCFETNYNQKTAADQKVFEFVKILVEKVEEVEALFAGSSSDTTIFVLSQYLAKLLKDTLPDNIARIVEIMVKCFQNWYDPKARAMIRGWNALRPFVVNSIWNLIGEGVKRVLMVEPMPDFNFFERLVFNNELGLLFWMHVTKTVGRIETQYGFSSLQTAILYYQDKVVPSIIEMIDPYFISLTETVKMNELVILQDNLKLVSTKQDPEMKRLLTFSDDELALAKMVLELVQTILDFPYNISYAQYDTEYYSGAQCVIYFSDSVSNKILKTDFYDSLFLLAERFIIELPQDSLLPVCLKCLKRIAMARVVSADSETKHNFVSKSLKGITRMMNILQNSVQSQEIIELNNKLVGNIPLRKFRKHKEFSVWLPLVQIHLSKNLFSRPLQFENGNYFECCQLLEKMAHGFISEKLYDYKVTFQQMTEKLFSELITRLLSQEQALHAYMDMESIKELKDVAQDFFDTIKQFIFYSPATNMALLLRFQTMVFQKLRNKQGVSANILFNLNLLVSRLFAQSVLNQTTSSLQVDQEPVKSLKEIYKNQLLFVNEYFREYRRQYSNAHLESSVLILLQTITTQLCNNIFIPVINDTKEKGVDKKNQAQQILNQSKLLGLVDFPQDNTEEFLTNLLSFISDYIVSENRKEAIFALDILNSCLVRLKWSIKRKQFKKLAIVKSVLGFCRKSQTPNTESKQFLKCRMQMVKLVSIVAFDDCLDSFKKELDTLFSELNTSSIMFLIYQLRGMAEQIDSSMIFKHFLQRGSSYLIKILQTVCTNSLNNEQVLKNSLRLCQFYFSNQIQRISSRGRVAVLICQLASGCLDYWEFILNFLNTELFDEPDKYVSSACYLIGCFVKMIEGEYLNLTHVQAINPRIDIYLNKLMAFVNKILKSNLLQYSKMKKQVVSFCSCIFKYLNDYIFNVDLDNGLVGEYCKLYSFGLVLLLEELDTEVLYSNLGQSFNVIMDFTSAAMQYQHHALLETHLKLPSLKARLFKDEMRHKVLEMFLTYVKAAVIGNVSSWRIEKLSTFLKEVILVYQDSAELLLQKVAADNPKSNLLLLQQFAKSCLRSDKSTWFFTFNEWLDSTREVEELEIIPVLMQ